MERMSGRISQIKMYAGVGLMLFGLACSESKDPEPPLGTPATEHHPNDGAKPNSDGSTTVTLGNIPFNTASRDFSSQPVVTDPKTITATLQDSYPFDANLSRYRVVGDKMIGVLRKDAFTTEMLVYSLTTKTKVSGHAPDYYIAGFDFNGAIMTVEGSENLNFYAVNEGGVISDHFFQIKAFQGSKFLSSCYLDSDDAFVYNENEILMFPIHQSKNVTKLMDIPAFSDLYYAADETYFYVLVGDISKSELRYVKKADMKVEKTVALDGVRSQGLSVDGNYLYYSDKLSGKVHVINKRTQSNSGSISVADPSGIEVIGSVLYVFNKSGNKLEKYAITFN
jgi:hypothetical protein